MGRSVEVRKYLAKYRDEETLNGPTTCGKVATVLEEREMHDNSSTVRNYSGEYGNWEAVMEINRGKCNMTCKRTNGSRMKTSPISETTLSDHRH